MKSRISYIFNYFHVIKNQVATAEASGLYSQEEYTKSGFDTLASFQYEDIQETDKEEIKTFEAMKKHRSLYFVAKRISSSS